MFRALGSLVLLITCLWSQVAGATAVGTGEWSIAAHASGFVHPDEPDWVTVGGLEVDVGYGFASRFRVEGVLLTLRDLRALGESESASWAVGARPLFRLGGILGDLELGGVLYAAYEPGWSDWGGGVLPVIGPHLRYTISVLSVFYEPLFFPSTSFKLQRVTTGSTFELEPSTTFFPLRLGVGLQF